MKLYKEKQKKITTDLWLSIQICVQSYYFFKWPAIYHSFDKA